MGGQEDEAHAWKPGVCWRARYRSDRQRRGEGRCGTVAVRVEAAEVGVLRDWNQGPQTVGSARIKDLKGEEQGVGVK